MIPRARSALSLLALSVVLVVLAIPPFNMWPLGLIGLAPLYLAIRNQTPVDGALFGWLYGFVLNLVEFSWAPGLLQRFGQATPVGAWSIAAGLCAYQGTVFAAWVATCLALERYARIPWLLSGPLCIVLAESAIPFIFPWNLAIVASRAWPLAQVAELGGAPAVSALVVLINLILAELALAPWRHRPPSRAVWRAGFAAAAVLVLGFLRAAGIALAQQHARHVRVGIVQPNAGVLDQEDRKVHGEEYLAVLRKGTAELARGGAELVVWPESAFPFLFDRRLTREYAAGHPWALRTDFHGALLFGALTNAIGDPRIYNSAVLVRSDGWIAGIYDKNRLVPFGEFIPLSDRFPDWARRLRARIDDVPEIAEGDAPLVLEEGDLRIGSLVCYEDIFADQVLQVAVRANLLVTLANHAWFRASAAAPQAQALATFRSIETRRALVRATDSGVSSFSDALGRTDPTGPLMDVPWHHTLPPTLLAAETPVLDIFAFGPRTIPFFPYACAVVLALGVIRNTLLLGRIARSRS